MDGWIGKILYHSLGSSKYCLLKTDCRPSERSRDTPHKLWVCLSKKERKVMKAHCSCMAGMGSTCNHVAAALFRVEAAMRLGLTNPACTEKACEWLPNRKDVLPIKMKDLNLNRGEFGKRGKKVKKLLPTPKKNYDPLADSNFKLLTFNNISTAVIKIVPNSMLSVAMLTPKIDFIREVLPLKEITTDIICIDDVILMSNSVEEFLANMKLNFTNETIKKIESVTKGQSENTAWFQFRKGTVTASKSHEIMTKMEKFTKGGGIYVNMWSLSQKISGLTLVNSNIPALKYGREMEEHAANTFMDMFKKTHKKSQLINC